MRKNFKLFSLTLSIVFCLASIAFGQETTGDLEGYVKDPSGAVVPNVTITITSAGNSENTTRTSVAVGFKRTLTTSD
ncbi:MAG TPA: hypothetical protein VF721_02260, partial [Pyrinomonadaceae bacterium]